MGNEFTSHELPCKMKRAQTVTIPYYNKMTPFIFGAQDNTNIYKYDYHTKKYQLFDKYRH